MSTRATTAYLGLTVLLLSAGGCMAPTSQQQRPELAIDIPPGPMGVQTRFDVDPLRGSAFEHAFSEATNGPVLIEASSVTHDLASGKTSVFLSIPDPSATLTDLSWQFETDPQLPLSQGDVRPQATAEPQGIKVLVDNPAARSFSLTVRLAGQVQAHAARRVLATTFRATSSSSLAGYGPERAVDGNLVTQWANGVYREPEASLTLDLGAATTVSSVGLKMRPFSGGAYYVLEASQDGNAFQAVSGHLRNSTWYVETKALTSTVQARYMRVHCYNDSVSPETRFEVYEAQLGATTSTPAPTPTPISSQTPQPQISSVASGSLNENFESYALGGDLQSFIDPLDEGYSYSWMPRVRWKVDLANGSKQYIHDGLNATAYLSFRRYRGNALGQDGQLPPRYHAQVAVTTLDTIYLQPTGDQGTQVYYLDPTHYLEVLLKPSRFEIWQSDGGQPFNGAGWTRLYYLDSQTSSNQQRLLGADVDVWQHTLTGYLDGKQAGNVSSTLLQNGSHYLALRGGGNIVAHDNLNISAR